MPRVVIPTVTIERAWDAANGNGRTGRSARSVGV